MSCSILILTLNEASNLPECLASVAWADDIVVFDSCSTDRTMEIARSAGARAIQRPFDNYASQRNAALGEVPYRHPWVLMLDADERVTPELREEIQRALAGIDESVGLFRVRRKDMFMGRWLRRSSGYPTWFGRLIRVGSVRVEREVNEEYRTEDRILYLQEHLIHYPFTKGIAFWFDRHNRYSTVESVMREAEGGREISWRGLLSRDPVVRRMNLKAFAYRLPGRPVLVFFYLYLIRLGILDGLAGLRFCVLRAIYEIMIDLKSVEIRRRSKGLPV